jgi:hypothetical protein
MHENTILIRTQAESAKRENVAERCAPGEMLLCLRDTPEEDPAIPRPYTITLEVAF